MTFAPSHGISRREIVERKEKLFEQGAIAVRALVVYESMYGEAGRDLRGPPTP